MSDDSTRNRAPRGGRPRGGKPQNRGAREPEAGVPALGGDRPGPANGQRARSRTKRAVRDTVPQAREVAPVHDGDACDRERREALAAARTTPIAILPEAAFEETAVPKRMLTPRPGAMARTVPMAMPPDDDYQEAVSLTPDATARSTGPARQVRAAHPVVDSTDHVLGPHGERVLPQGRERQAARRRSVSRQPTSPAPLAEPHGAAPLPSTPATTDSPCVAWAWPARATGVQILTVLACQAAYSALAAMATGSPAAVAMWFAGVLAAQLALGAGGARLHLAVVTTMLGLVHLRLLPATAPLVSVQCGLAAFAMATGIITLQCAWWPAPGRWGRHGVALACVATSLVTLAAVVVSATSWGVVPRGEGFAPMAIGALLAAVRPFGYVGLARGALRGGIGALDPAVWHWPKWAAEVLVEDLMGRNSQDRLGALGPFVLSSGDETAPFFELADAAMRREPGLCEDVFLLESELDARGEATDSALLMRRHLRDWLSSPDGVGGRGRRSDSAPEVFRMLRALELRLARARRESGNIPQILEIYLNLAVEPTGRAAEVWSHVRAQLVPAVACEDADASRLADVLQRSQWELADNVKIVTSSLGTSIGDLMAALVLIVGAVLAGYLVMGGIHGGA